MTELSKIEAPSWLSFLELGNQQNFSLSHNLLALDCEVEGWLVGGSVLGSFSQLV